MVVGVSLVRDRGGLLPWQSVFWQSVCCSKKNKNKVLMGSALRKKIECSCCRIDESIRSNNIDGRRVGSCRIEVPGTVGVSLVSDQRVLVVGEDWCLLKKKYGKTKSWLAL